WVAAQTRSCAAPSSVTHSAISCSRVIPSLRKTSTSRGVAEAGFNRCRTVSAETPYIVPTCPSCHRSTGSQLPVHSATAPTLAREWLTNRSSRQGRSGTYGRAHAYTDCFVPGADDLP